jgi:hypothetical protein
MTLLCRYHHTHFLQKGWTCRINADQLPEWIPPCWIDQAQRPQTNTRIQRLHANANNSLGDAGGHPTPHESVP